MNIALRFVEGGGIDSKIIRWDTRCKFSHVEYFDETRNLTLGSMLKGGVKYRSLRDAAYQRALSVEFKRIDATPAQFNVFHNYLISQIGAPYDWRAIASFGLGERDWRDEDSWFCSELQARALEVAGILTLPLDIPVCRITPRDLWVLTAFCKTTNREALNV